MARALWLILYDLDAVRADEYLHWFHAVHIPEKLARPGYSWAAHYRLLDAQGADTQTYCALFGGRDSRVFYDPSPAQIKPRQTPETRAMMACRSNSRMLILAEEWTAGDKVASDMPIEAERIELALFDANGNDEQLGAWLAQTWLSRADPASKTGKWLSSTGTVRHLLLHEQPLATRDPMFVAAASDGSDEVAGYLSFPAGLPRQARRVWPPID